MRKGTEALLREIEALYRQKCTLLTGYLAMAQAQADMLAAGELAKVAAVLAAKDKRIGEINLVDARLADRFADLLAGTGMVSRESALAADLPGAAAAAQAREAVSALLARIQPLEAANAAAVRRELDALGREIGAMRERKAAAGSYKPPVSPSDGAFLDKRK